jgi:hypothetical protein
VLDFDETILNPNDINVFVPEATVRTSGSAFGKTQRMVYWRQDGQKLYVDVVAPQGIASAYMKIYVLHPKGVNGSPGFGLITSAVYAVDGSAMTLQPTLEYSP